MLPEGEGGEKASRLLVTFDGQTSPIVPSRGLFVRGLLRHFDDTPDVVSEVPEEPVPANPERFTQGEVVGSWFHRARGEDRFFVGGGAGTSFGETTVLNSFRLGGLLHLGAFNADQIAGSNYVNLNTGYLKQVGRMPDVIGGNIYVGSWLETGSAWDKWHEKDWRNNVTARSDSRVAAGSDFLRGQLQQRPRAVLRGDWALLPMMTLVAQDFSPVLHQTRSARLALMSRTKVLLHWCHCLRRFSERNP